MDISIIIPTYNRLWSLPQTIESCRNTSCSIEIIVIDDGSSDTTWEWLKSQTDIKAIKQENLGKCWAVNRGFELATGKYIRFLDSDDLLSPKANDEQLVLAEETGADVVVSGYQVIDENNKVLRSQLWVDCDDFIAQQLGECDSSHYSSYLFRKNFIKDIPHRPDFAFRDDRLYVLETALKNPQVSIHHRYALSHRVHTQERLQFTSASNHMIQNAQHLKIYQKILGTLAKNDALNQRRKNASLNTLWVLAHWIAKYDLKEASSVVEWVFEMNPNFNPPEKGMLGKLYRTLGFKRTEKLLRFRRALIRP
ncbi:glycosyltransferase family 2 protein [Pedobacter sp. ISL-68]|uniref:glycosyltransferase family 2 protein n=1 Tax=unclassified Pedobacter TaxID=2628915 RepID=UPI001BE66C69|nr:MULTISPECIES: glycosyltransferase family 2 protein [unclassified Pedobacter]MBT2562800.1 glycosyltransferase family 2 protein [Pedobacter sp. ISL-64]MBT2593313.1 glycosyltransferase family 2 protein [Pedobacter sp. ISL-68]